MSKSTKPKGKDNSMKILYWMGAGVVVLLLGVVALALLNKPKPRVVADPQRTLVYLFDASVDRGVAVVLILEESRSQQTLQVAAFRAPDVLMQAYQHGRVRGVVNHVSADVGRKVHHWVGLPMPIISTLIDRAGGINLEGARMSGGQAISYLLESNHEERTARVLLGLAEAVATRGVTMTIREGFQLLGQIDTSLDPTSVPDVLSRWQAYSLPQVRNVSLETLDEALMPDPVAPGN